MFLEIFKIVFFILFILFHSCIVDTEGKLRFEDSNVKLQSRTVQETELEESTIVANTDKCASIECQNGGVCKIIENEPVCECLEEYKGKNCESHKCHGILCQNNGTCQVNQGQAKCECLKDFSGKNCEILSKDACARYLKVCAETGGDCKPAEQGFQCKCPPYLEFDRNLGCLVPNWLCNNKKPDCLKTGGSCMSTKDKGTVCRCPEETEYYEKKGGCIIFDPCKDGPCQNGGTCITQGKQFRCVCKEPFTGTKCDESIFFDPCKDSPCQNGGTCIAQGKSFRCVCKEPFTGTKCEEISKDKCSRYLKNCQETGGDCAIENGRYVCKCPFGRNYAQHFGCNVSREYCKSFHFNCEETGGYCISTENQTTACRCPNGTEYYYYKGCIVPNTECSRNRTNCKEADKNFITMKDAILKLLEVQWAYLPPETENEEDIRNLVDTLKCDWTLEDCRKTGGSCITKNGKIVCECPKGTEYQQGCVVPKGMCSRYHKNCEETGGICTSDENKEIQCKCSSRYSIYRSDIGCQVSDDECEKHRPNCIETGGSCMQDEKGRIRCRCPDKLRYMNGCEDPCNKYPCLNGGRCHANGNNVECICEKAYSGKYCEITTEVKQRPVLPYVVIIAVLVMTILILVVSLICCVIHLRRKQ